MYEYDKHNFLFEGITQELRYYAYVLPGAQKHWTLSLRQNWAHLWGESMPHAALPVCSGYFWPSPCLVGMLPNMGVSVQSERTAHRHVVFHRDLRRKGRLELASILWFQFGFLGRVIWNEPNSYTILFTASSLFSDFFHRIWYCPESYSRSTKHIHLGGEAVTMNYQCGKSWRSYNIFWNKPPPSGEMIFLTRDGCYSINFQKSLKYPPASPFQPYNWKILQYFFALFELTVLEVIGKA